ncbi:hypothetical protein BDV11DRAFT_168729 [Aspergillus similis]
MAAELNEPSDDKLSALWQAACADYAKEIGKPLGDVALTGVRGPEDLSRHLEAEKDNFEDFRMKRRPLLHAMQTVIVPFETWGGLIAVAAFPPASTIMGAMMLLIQGTKKVSEAFDMITDLFRRLGHFALRLESYKGVPLSEGMKVIIVKVLVNFLRVCAASQKLVSRGSLKARLAKWAKSMFLEDGEIAGLLSELEELTSQEHMMVSAHGLKTTHQALSNTEELLKRDSQRHDHERLQRVKAALNPVSGSNLVFSSINENRIPGSGAWVEERLRSWLEGSEPILWLHGGPGVGKSFIASKIITEILRGELSAAPAPVVASFFCRNNDVDLRSLNKALRTLAWQVVTQRDDFAAHAEEFCLKEDPENSYAVWRKLLLDYLTKAPSQGTYFVIDGLDEAEPKEQEILCSLLGKTFSEESVRGLLEEHSLAWIEEIEVGNDQNKDDLNGYVAEKLQKTKLFRGSSDFQEEIVGEICRGAEGLWEWANLVIKSVLRCRTKEQIRKTIRTMPRGISAMLTQEVQRLAKELGASDEVAGGGGLGEEDATQLDQLKIVLSFVTLAQKPLKVTQLELILEIVFKEEVLGLEDDLRTTYSSLFLLQPDTDPNIIYHDRPPEVVVLRHSSFYEFFRRTDQSGPLSVDVDQTEVNFLYVLLSALHEKELPKTERWTGELRDYAGSFMHTHFMNAIPENAGRPHGEISTLFHDLFSKQGCMDWFIKSVLVRYSGDYCRYPVGELTNVAEFWLDVTDREVINKRAEMTMQWLLPEVKEAFRENARASTVASDLCPFTVLFSYMAENCLRHWLEPVEIKADDGMPGAIPIFLRFYADMVTAYATKQASRENELWGFRLRYIDVSEIFAAAELQKQERTPFWHARVGQALLPKRHFREARGQFQIALNSHVETPTFDAPSLSVIHRDMSRACSAIRLHTEALEHHELSEQLARGAEAQEPDDEALEQVCNRARLKHRAGRTEDAVEMADRAWRRDIEKYNLWPGWVFEAFFRIFIELHQPQRLPAVFERIVGFYERDRKEQSSGEDFTDYFLEQIIYSTRTFYQVLQYVLTPDDNEHLDHLAVVIKKLSTSEWNRLQYPTERYLLATVLFSKGRVSLGLDGWCQVASFIGVCNRWEWWATLPAARSIGHLGTVCLEQPEIPLSEHCPLKPTPGDQMDEIYLVISTWLRKRGDLPNARQVLRGRRRYMTLFKTFVTDPDSHEDCEAALYLLKEANERHMGRYNTVVSAREANAGAARGSSESSEDSQLADDKVDDAENDDDLMTALYTLDECSNCWKEVKNIHFWYFCRSCPYTMLCRRCYRELKGRPHPSGLFGTCTSEHEFFYTGGFLRRTQLVDDGMVPLVSSDGERRAIWVEEWKDKLAEKWQTKDFEYEGGFSAWCMRVLPEPQRTRWAAFFQT